MLSESFTDKVEVELRRINKEVEIELVKKMIYDLSKIFEISEED